MTKIPFIREGLSFNFNLLTFEEEIFPGGRNVEVSLDEAIHQFFEFKEETKFNASCFYSERFKGFILPVSNLKDRNNFVIIKGDQLFNPNEFQGYATSDKFSSEVLVTTQITELAASNSWVLFTENTIPLVKLVIQKLGITPCFSDTMEGNLFRLAYSAPENWFIDGVNLKIQHPTVEDRTILINLLDSKDYVEFNQNLIILINEKNIKILQKQCSTLYSVL